MNKANEILGEGQGQKGSQTTNVTINPSRTQNGENSGANTGGGFMEKIKSNPALKGARSLAGRYGIPVIKGVPKATLGALAGATGAMAGFAGGVAQGDIGAALKGAVAGGTAGSGLAKGVMNFGSNLGTNTRNLVNDIKDTFNEGAYGEEQAQNIRMLREFKQTSDYKELRQKYGDQLTDEKLSELLKATMKEQENKK